MHICQDGQSTASGPKWTKMDLFRPKWTILVHFGLVNAKIRFRVFLSKVGPIWHFSVLCLLALGDTIPKP